MKNRHLRDVYRRELLPFDGKRIRERFVRALASIVDSAYLRRVRPHTDRRAEPLDHGILTGNTELDVARGEIDDPTAQSKPASLFANEPAKAHTLNPSRNSDMET